MIPLTRKTLTVASKAELTNEHYIRRLWLAARNQPFSRRQWPDVIADAIYRYDGVILCPMGQPWPVPDVDDVLGDSRWFSYYFEETGGLPRRKVKLTERLRLIDLYFRLEKPDLQQHFSK